MLSPDDSTPIVHVELWYHVGSKDEKAGRTGFAHLFEHMMFKGSKNVEPEEHASMLASIGGQSNAYTNDDATVFWQTVPSQYLPLVLWMEADRMATLRIDKATFENEREVVKEERRLRVDNQPFGRLSEILYDTFYTVSPYKHTTIGSMKDLDAASVEDVRDFHNTFYVPHNATMAIVGDFDMAQAKELVTKYFGRIPKSDRVISREYPREKPTTAERRVTVNEAWPLPAVIVAYPITWDGNPDSYPLHLTSKILSDGDSSRIYQSLVYEKGIALIGIRRRQHHRGTQSVLRGRARGAGPHARRGREGAHRRVRQAAHRSRSPSTSCSAPRTSSFATTSSIASRFAERPASWRMRW